MIGSVLRAGLLGLRRDRAALALTFVVPIVFFSIFASVFGGSSDRATTRRVPLLVVDEDGSERSRRLLEALAAEKSLDLRRAPRSAADRPPAPDYDRASAEAAVRAGTAPVALVVPSGFGAAAIAFGPSQGDAARPRLELLADRSDPIAPQLVAGMIQKTLFVGMPELPMASGLAALERSVPFTPEQKAALEALSRRAADGNRGAESGQRAQGDESRAPSGELVEIAVRDLFGETKKRPMIAFYAAGLGVMFLMFSAAGAGGALIEERESGTLDRLLSTRVTMGRLLAGKLLYLSLIGLLQLATMFAWGWALFGLELSGRIPGALLMAIPTVFATSAFGLVLAALSKSRKQLVALSNLVILSMSALGGSMFPRFLMPEAVQKLGLVAFNSWALEGFLDVFWRELPLAALLPEIAVLTGSGLLFFLLARRLARRWEFA